MDNSTSDACAEPRRILFLTTAHNSLSQALALELQKDGKYVVSVELALSEKLMDEAVSMFQPKLIVCPFLTTKVPESIYTQHVVLIVHPGIPGDAGPSSLDYAVMHGEKKWGVTVLQADGEFDKGPIWEAKYFDVDPSWTKSAMYKHGVVPAALTAATRAVHRYFRHERHMFTPADFALTGIVRHLMRQEERAFDWATDDPKDICKRVAMSDSQPGVRSSINGYKFFVYGASIATAEDMKGLSMNAAPDAAGGDAHAQCTAKPGEVIGWRDGSVLVCTGRGPGVWISQLRKSKIEEGAGAKVGLHPKLPATLALQVYDVIPKLPSTVPDLALPNHADSPDAARRHREIWYDLSSDKRAAFVYTEFCGGAMSTDQAKRMLKALQEVESLESVRVVVMMGGRDFFSNGIHLCTIEVAEDPAQESWENINAIDDVVHQVLRSNKMYMTAFRGNAGAGGVVLGAAADVVVCRQGVVLNPHYKAMGLYGSEYWTYILPHRMSRVEAESMTESMMPMSAQHAKDAGLVDQVWDMDADTFERSVRNLAVETSHDEEEMASTVARRLQEADEESELALARERELKRMRENFWGEDRTYHNARHDFVHKLKPRKTPLHFALHRQLYVNTAVSPRPATRELWFSCLASP